MEAKKLTRLVVTKDGRTKTISGKKVNAIAIGKPFVLEDIECAIYLSNFSPYVKTINSKLKNRKGVDAYCLGNPINTHTRFEDCASGGHVDVKYASCPIQLYKINKRKSRK